MVSYLQDMVNYLKIWSIGLGSKGQIYTIIPTILSIDKGKDRRDGTIGKQNISGPELFNSFPLTSQ